MPSSSGNPDVIVEPFFESRKSILPDFDDEDSSSDRPSTYILDIDLPEFDTRLIPSPQFRAFVSGTYLGDSKTYEHNEQGVSSTLKKHSSFAELEADCSALQFDSEVIVLTRPRNELKTNSTYSMLPPPVASKSRSTSPMPPHLAPPEQSVVTRKESKYQRNAPPHLQLKVSNYDHRRRYSRRVSVVSARIETRSPVVGPSTLTPRPADGSTSPISALAVAHPDTPLSIKTFRFSYASSKRQSRIYFSTKELHRRRILKLQRTFGERVPLELVAVSPRRRHGHTNSIRPLSIVSYRGPCQYMTSPVRGMMNPSVHDWTLDSIAPLGTGLGASPAVKSPCNFFRISVVGRGSDVMAPKKVLRKSQYGPRGGRAAKPDDESLEVIEHEGIAEEEEGGLQEDRGDNSIWLDEVQPPSARRNVLQPSRRLIPGAAAGYNGRELQEFTAAHTTQIYHDEQVHLSTHLTSMLPYMTSESSEPDAGSTSPTRSSSPSMPAFHHGSDIEHTSDMQHQRQRQNQLPAPPMPAPHFAFTSPGMPSPALYWPRMPFSTPVSYHQYNSSTGSERMGSHSEQRYLDEFMHPHENVSSSKRNERRQGWSGEWNQPSIQDVIQKLRDM